MKNNTVNLDLKWKRFTISFFLHGFHGNITVGYDNRRGEWSLFFKDKNDHRIKYLGLYST